MHMPHEEQQTGASMPVFHWSAPTHVETPRSVDWYWALGLIAACGVVISIWLGDTLFAAIITIAALIIGVVTARGPREHDVSITEEAVIIDHDVYPFETVRSFWVDADGLSEPRLYLSTAALLHPHLIVLLPSAEYAKSIYTFLSERVPEEERHSAGTIIARVLGW